MDPIRNPFAPGAGTTPPELVGRGSVLESARVSLARLKLGRSGRSQMLIGLRGVGKTVLLNRIREEAEEQGYKALLLETPEDRSLGGILYPPLRKLLIDLDRGEKLSEKVKRGLRVLRSFANSVSIKVGDVEVGLDIDPELGSADSGDFESDLADLLVAIAEAARDRGTSVAIIIDELQYVATQEFAALITAIHRVSQRSLPLTLIGAGLPQLAGQAGNAKSYAERLFEFTEIGPLSAEDATLALQRPANKEEAEFTLGAMSRIFEITKGYPYFLQEWGYNAWNIASSSTIDEDAVVAATGASIQKLDNSFFRVRLDRLTPMEKRYVRAMADLGAGPHRSSDIAHRMNRDIQKLGPTRSSLIKKGMIYSPSHGDTAFTVPLFDEFMRRHMPEFRPY